MPRIKDDAIVLRETDWSEASQVVTLLTRGHGKLRGLAKGARRQSPSSVQRFSGGINLLTAGQVVASLRPLTGLATLTEWDLQQPWPHLRQDLAALHAALYAVDLANALLAEQDPHPASFAALHELLAALAGRAIPAEALALYQWRLLADGGFAPHLQQDARTGQPLTEAPAYLFDPHAAGLTADPNEQSPRRPGAGPVAGGFSGGISGGGPWRVRRATVEALRTLAAGDTAPMRALDADTLTRLNRLLCAYARTILDRELPTMRFVLGE